MVEIHDTEPSKRIQQGVTAEGVPWCHRCPDGECAGLAVLAECEIRKGVPLPAPFDGMFTKGEDNEKEKP